jgi:cell division protein ZapA (FtsZ GTPase activity inhibitor)
MEATPTPLEVIVRGRTFRLNAPANERESLADAIAVVQGKCDAMATMQPSADSERVLLLVALELAAQHGNQPSAVSSNGDYDSAARIAALQLKIDHALARAASAAQA